MSVEKLSDEQLMEIAGIPHPKSLSDEELANIAGVKLPKNKIAPGDVLKNYFDSPAHAAQGGVSQSLLNLLLAPGNFADKTISKMAGAKPSPVDFDLVGETQHPNFAKAGEITGALASPQLGIAKAASTASAIPKALRSLLGNAGEGAAYGTLMSASNPNSDSAEAAKRGGIFGGVAGTVAPLLSKAGGAISKAYYGSRTPEEAAKISDIAGDLPIPAGDIVNSPILKTLYSALRLMPGSGVKESRQNLIAKTDAIPTGIINKLKGDTTKGLVNSELQKAIADNYNRHYEDSTNKYLNLAEQMDKAGIDVPTHGNFTNEARNILKNESKMRGFTVDKGLISTLQKAIEDKSEGYSYKDTHFTRSRMLEKQREAAKNNKITESNIYGQMANALEKDISQAVDASGNKKLIDMRNEASNHFKENVVPYRNKDIFDFIKLENDEPISRRINTEKITDYLMKPQNKKIIEHMTPEQRNLLQFSVLGKKAEETPEGIYLGTPQTATTFKNLSQPQRDILFDKKQQEELKRISDLSYITSEIRKRAKPPATGFALKDDAEEAAKISTMVALLSHGVPGLALLGGAVKGSNMLRSLLENPQFRAQLIKNKGKPSRLPDSSSLAAALTRIYNSNPTRGNQ